MIRVSKTLLALSVLAFPLLAQVLSAQSPGGGRGGGPRSAKAAAPVDLTGYWVSIVTEDWRYRMVTPAPGDYQGVPMTAAARKVADTWDALKEEASGNPCKSYGAPALLRVPTRLHITWKDEQTLEMDSDAGKQTRVFHFATGEANPTDSQPTLQGYSVAHWQIQRPAGPAGANAGAPPGGSLEVATSHLQAGYLRKNGVPYSENASLNEFYDLVKERNGDLLMVVTIVVTDPLYLREPFIISSHFKKQASDAGWSPAECSAKW